MPGVSAAEPPYGDVVYDDVVRRLRSAGCVFAEEEARLLLEAAAEGPADRGRAAGGPGDRGPADGALAAMVARRAAGHPLEHVLGWAEFCGRRWAVGPGAFVPRRRSEFLVAVAAGLAPGAGAVLLDLCCGVGALGGAVAARIADRAGERVGDGTADRGRTGDPGAGAAGVRLYAADVGPAAVRYARVNLAPFGGRVFEGDLYGPLPAELRGRVDVLVANAPYVPTGEIGLLPPEAREHEPLVALDGGADGVDVQRRVVAQAPAWLAPGGHLLIETGEHQADLTAAAFERAGLRTRVVADDELGATVVVGRRAPEPPSAR